MLYSGRGDAVSLMQIKDVQLGAVMVTVHREGRKTEVPLGGSRQIIDARDVQRACAELGLDPAQLPGARSRV